jgi:hypothetical protein
MVRQQKGVKFGDQSKNRFICTFLPLILFFDNHPQDEPQVRNVAFNPRLGIAGFLVTVQH